ncbi:hypothetical protein QJU96_10490 [Pasteurella skyensis]|uniref:hypothetical protein n=1 Tax=Phocoenobacter skyensis TaxID=97481 RepID=UPI0027951252|nr:hypothetical protein [Pasteurella skyensis]MDP8171707.1 hypothetical protein [Pasteurella skyensis]
MATTTGLVIGLAISSIFAAGIVRLAISSIFAAGIVRLAISSIFAAGIVRLAISSIFAAGMVRLAISSIFAAGITFFSGYFIFQIVALRLLLSLLAQPPAIVPSLLKALTFESPVLSDLNVPKSVLFCQFFPDQIIALLILFSLS